MVRIIMLKPPSYAPDFMKDSDGVFTLDLLEGQRIALTRVIDDYINPGEIKQDTFKELELPITKKNRILLGNIGNPSALNEDNSKIFNIQILKAGFSYPVQGLQVVSVTDKKYNVTIFGELNDWARPMDQLFLNQLDIGSATVDYTWINARHNDNWLYEDTDFAVFPPLVNYGSWFVPAKPSTADATQQVVFENWRFWTSPLALLRAAFCAVGYTLVAPMLEAEEFRRHWLYLLDPEFETANQADLPNRGMEIQKIAPEFFEFLFQRPASGIKLEGVINIFDVISDPGSHLVHNPPVPSSTEDYWGGFYSGGIIGNFVFNGTVRINLTSGTLFPVATNFVTLTVSISKSYRYGIQDQDDLLAKSTKIVSKTVVYKSPLVSGVPIDFVFDLQSSNVQVRKYEVVFIRVEYAAELVDGGGAFYTEADLYDQTTLLAGSTFKVNPITQVIEEGDTLDFGLMLRKDLTPRDVIRGVAHAKLLKIETDTINKRVYMFPEFYFDWYISGIQEGYFKNNTDDPLDLTELIQAGTMQQSFKNTDLPRDVYLKYKDSTDGYILQKNLEDELHSKRIDLGPRFREGINEYENPLIEPLDTGIDEQLGPNGANWIPFMWETQPTESGTYPETGYKFAPRWAISYPLANNVQASAALLGRDNPANSLYIYEDQLQGFYNLFGQIFPDGLTLVIVPGPNITPDLANVYGNDQTNTNIKDYWTMYYSRAINQAYFNIALNFLVHLSLIEFSNLSFRRKVLVKYLSEPWGQILFYARLSRVEDFVIGENLTTPVELLPDNNNFTNC